jgi:hypothetical protein
MWDITSWSQVTSSANCEFQGAGAAIAGCSSNWLARVPISLAFRRMIIGRFFSSQRRPF